MSQEIKRGVRYIKSRDRYRAWFQVPGQPEETKTTFVTEGEAQAWLDDQIGKHREGKRPSKQKSQMTFADFAEQRFKLDTSRRVRTRVGNSSQYKHYIKPRWGDVRLCDITTDDIEEWVALLPTQLGVRTQKPLSISYQHQIYWLFHKLLRQATPRILPVSPLPDESGLPSKPQSRKLEPLTAAQVARLAEECKHYSEMIYVMAYGGFRIGEACALRVNDFDFVHNEVSVDEQLVASEGGVHHDHDLKRERSQRSVPMPVTVMTMVWDMINSTIGWHDPTTLVFRGVRTGRRLDPSAWRVRHFRPAAIALGLGRYVVDPETGKEGYDGMTPHYLRHCAASAWFDEGFDIVEVARFLGDSLDVAEKTYTHMHKGRQHEQMHRMDDRIERGIEMARRAELTVVPMRPERPERPQRPTRPQRPEFRPGGDHVIHFPGQEAHQ